jgi:hypothetical protein
MRVPKAQLSVEIEETAMTKRNRMMLWLEPPIMVPIILVALFWIAAAIQK